MATEFFCARRTRKMALELLSCVRRIKKGGNEPQTTIFNLFTDKISLHWHDWQFEWEWDRSQIRTTHRSIRSKSTDRSKTILAMQCNLDLHFCTSLYWRRNLLYNVYRSKFCQRKMRFLKEGDKTAVKAIDSSVKNHWSWKWPDAILEHSFGNFGPIKYKIGECIKKNWRSWDCMVYVVWRQDQLCK